MIVCKSLLGFDFDHIEEFSELEVRINIIDPLIKELGYFNNGENRVVREKRLKNPFIRVGTSNREVQTIPDYVMMVKNSPQWILEAKAPCKNIDLQKHIEQAYSYASHIEIQAKYFALCNGKEFVLYSLEKIEPIMKFEMKDIHFYMEKLLDLLAPSNIILAKKYKKDYGMYLLSQGITCSQDMYYYDLEIDNISRIDSNIFTIGRSIESEGTIYEVSFDLSYDIFLMLRNKIPNESFDKLNSWNNHIVNVQFVGERIKLNIKCKLSNEIIEVDQEIFKPLIITDIF